MELTWYHSAVTLCHVEFSIAYDEFSYTVEIFILGYMQLSHLKLIKYILNL